MLWRFRFALLLMSLGLQLGCLPRLDGAPCSSDENCPNGQTCHGLVCLSGSVPPENLHSASDSGLGDAGVLLDAGFVESDAGSTDAGLVESDAGSIDAGSVESDAGLVGAPASYSFGNVVIGSVSSPASFTITNTAVVQSGELMLNVEGSFLIVNNECSATLALDESCHVYVVFTPTAEGEAAALLSVSGMPGGTLEFGLSGKGVAPASLTLSPTSLDLGSVALGNMSSAQTFTIRNTGESPSGPLTVTTGGANESEFDTASGCIEPLAPGAECAFSLVFVPASPGSKTATVEVSASPGGEVSATLTATGLTAAKLSATPEMGVFASTVQGQMSPSITFTIANSGQATSPLLATVVEGSNALDFAITNDNCNQATVAAESSCGITVQMQPSGTGSRNAFLTVSGSGLVPVLIPLDGAGLRQAQLSMSPKGNVSFGEVATNSSQTIVFGVTNEGQAPTGPLSAALVGADFSIPSTTCNGSLSGGASCEVSVRFSPSTAESKSGRLEVSAGPGGIQSADISGIGVAPGALVMTPATLDFGDLFQGQSSTQLFTVRNSGSTGTTIPSVTLSGSGAGFSQTNTCTTALPASATCGISVTFAPNLTIRHQQNAQVQVSATVGGTVSGSVVGNALAPATLEVSPGTASFPDTMLGSTSASTVSLTVTNTGDQPTGALTVSASNADFAVVPESGDCRDATLSAAGSCTVRVAFKPQQTQVRTGTLSVTASPGGTDSTSLTGVGLSAASLTLTPVTSSDFGDVDKGKSASLDFTLSNPGQAASGPVSVTLSGPDAASFKNVTDSHAGNCVAGATLAANSSCNLRIRFHAKGQSGNKQVTLRAEANPGGTATLNLTGNVQRH